MKAGINQEEQQELRAFSREYQPSLLLVDDEASIRTSLAAVLRFCRPEFHIGTASSAEEALTILEHTEIDLLITDLKLPEMDGLSLVQATLLNHPDTRSILMTAFGTDSVDYGAYHSGCVSYLEKPFEVEALLQSIDETLDDIRATELPAEGRLVEAVRLAAQEKLDLSIRITAKKGSGLLVMRNSLITYADFDGLLGTSALVAMLACHEPRLVCSADAPELSNADLPVCWSALVRASFYKSVAQQIAELRDSGRQQSEPNSSSYPSVDKEAFFQKEILAELIQHSREARQASEVIGDVKRKRLHFHQSLQSDMIKRQVQLRNLINSGIEFYSAQNFTDARRCWQEALQIDPNCQQAKHNLEYLDGKRLRSAS